MRMLCSIAFVVAVRGSFLLYLFACACVCVCAVRAFFPFATANLSHSKLCSWLRAWHTQRRQRPAVESRATIPIILRQLKYRSNEQYVIERTKRKPRTKALRAEWMSQQQKSQKQHTHTQKSHRIPEICNRMLQSNGGREWHEQELAHRHTHTQADSIPYRQRSNDARQNRAKQTVLNIY